MIFNFLVCYNPYLNILVSKFKLLLNVLNFKKALFKTSKKSASY